MSVLIRYIYLILTGLILLCAYDIPVRAEQSLAVKFPVGPLPDAQVNVLQSGDLLYIDLNSFADALNIHTYINNAKGKIQFTVGAIRIIFTTDNAFVVVGSEVIQFPAEVIWASERFWAPLDAFLNTFTGIYPAEIEFERYSWTINIRPSKFDTYAIEYNLKGNGTLIRISCSKLFDISGAALRNKRLSITLLGAKINRKAFESTPVSGAVKKLIVEELPEAVQLTFKLNTNILEHTVWQDENTYQINISLITKRISSESDSEAIILPNEEIADFLEDEQEKWKIDCIVIDPGHGGKDPGAIGATGLYEKTVVLDIALRLQKLIKKETDLKVVLTRDDDTFIPLKNRTKFANQAGGKLFISLHCNSSKYKSAHGFETFFLKPARNESAMEVALLENSVIKYEESRSQYQDLTEENYILLAMAQAEFARESESLAAIVQNKLKIHTQQNDRGVDQAGFYVLVGASMPAILVETGFISNKREEKLHKTKKFRQKVAQAVFDSIMEFKRQEERKSAATSSAQR